MPSETPSRWSESYTTMIVSLLVGFVLGLTLGGAAIDSGHSRSEEACMAVGAAFYHGRCTNLPKEPGEPDERREPGE